MRDTFHPAFRPSVPFIGAIAAGLLALYAILAFTASLQKGASFDEGEELAIGYNIWVRHDFRMEAANGDFVKRWATLPFLVSRPRFPGIDDPIWRGGQPYRLAFRFLFASGNDPQQLLRQGRAMEVLLGMAMGLLVFTCSREIFGDLGGLISLIFSVFCPHMLAFGGIVSTEMSTSLALLGSTWCIWRLLHRITWGRLGGSLVFLSLLFASKPTAMVIFPITAVLLVVRLIGNRPLRCCLGRPITITSRRSQAMIFCALIAIHGIFSWGGIWACYDFRYAASPNPADPGITLRNQRFTDPIDPSVSAFLTWCRQTHLFPEGYVRGIKWLLGSNDMRQAFMNGQWKIGGWRLFFPYAIWAKTSPILILFLVLGLLVSWQIHKTCRMRSNGSEHLSFYNLTPYFTLALVYLAVAIMQNVDIGHRHVFPMYPALYILVGSVAPLLLERTAWVRATIVALVLCYAADSSAVYPHYLAYFSPWVGGPEQGYKHLVDSSLDWGMDLPGLKQWLGEHNPGGQKPLYLAYFGTGNPEYYHIAYKPLFLTPDWNPHQIFPLTPGIYAISATLLQTVGTVTFGPWNEQYEHAYQSCLKNLQTFDRTQGNPKERTALIKQFPEGFWDREYVSFEKLRFGRLCAWLRHCGAPDDNVGYSILIWRLDEAALHRALIDPPVERDPLYQG